MKNILRSVLLVALLATFSCTKSELAAPEEQNLPEGVSAVIMNPVPDAVATKAISEDMKFSWGAKDKIDVIRDGSGEQMIYSIKQVGENDRTCVFSVSNFNLNDGTFYSLYPTQGAIDDPAAIPVDLGYMVQKGKNNTDHLALYDFNVASSDIKGNMGSFKYDRLVSWVRLRLTFDDACEITEVFIYSGDESENFITKATIDIFDGTVTPVEKSDFAAIYFEDLVEIEKGEDIWVYLPVLPTSFETSTFDITACDRTTGKRHYATYVAGEGTTTFTANKYKTWDVTFGDGVAIMDGKVYTSLDEAFDAVENTPKTITMIANGIGGESAAYIENGKNVTLDLNGHKVIGNKETMIMVDYGGELTVVDSKGKGSLTNEGRAIYNAGTLTVNSGTIQCTDEAKEAIYVAGGLTRAVLNINGGTVSGQGKSVGSNCTTGNTLTFNISGGVFDGLVNFDGDVLNVTGGTFNNGIHLSGADSRDNSISGGKFKGQVTSDNAVRFISGGVYADDVISAYGQKNWLVENYSLRNNPDDATYAEGYHWAVVKPNTCRIGDVEFQSIGDAFSYLHGKGSCTITMLEDEMFLDETSLHNRTLEVLSYDDVVIDLNGHTITKLVNSGTSLIENSGKLTITDKSGTNSGCLTNVLDPDYPGTWNGDANPSGIISNFGALSIENCKIDNSLKGAKSRAIYSTNRFSLATIDINNAVVTCEGQTGILMDCDYTTIPDYDQPNSVTVSGENSIVAGYNYGIYMQNVWYNGNPVGIVTVNGGTVKSYSSVNTSFSLYCPKYSSNFQINILGGNFPTRIAADRDMAYNDKLNIQGGTIVDGKIYTPDGNFVIWPSTVLPGEFTVDAEGGKVSFAQGNLYWDGIYFNFEEHQYDCQVSWSASHVSHFYWSKTADTAYAVSYNESQVSNSDVFFTNETETTANAGFVVNGEPGRYRTLSNNEWKYIFNTRTVNGGTGEGKSYSLGITYGSKKGVVLYPDNYTGSALSGEVTELPDGVVFLPAAGWRYSETTIGDAGVLGNYVTSSNYLSDPNKVYYVKFDGNSATVGSYDNRGYGRCVRLVVDVE